MEDFDVVTGPAPGKVEARRAPSPQPSPRGEREKETTPDEPAKAEG
jgi:hypothetical protein